MPTVAKLPPFLCHRGIREGCGYGIERGEWLDRDECGRCEVQSYGAKVSGERCNADHV